MVLAETCRACCGCADAGVVMFQVEKSVCFSRPAWGGGDDEKRGSLLKDSKNAAMCLRRMWRVNNIARHGSTTTTNQCGNISYNPIYSSVHPICIDLKYTATDSSIFLVVASSNISKHIPIARGVKQFILARRTLHSQWIMPRWLVAQGLPLPRLSFSMCCRKAAETIRNLIARW